MTFYPNLIRDMLCTKSHIYVAKVTEKHVCVVKCCWIISLLQCMAIIRLPSDTFALWQLTVTLFMRFKFSLQVSNKYSIFKFLVFIRVVSTIHVASTQELY